jgi:hypothetical protein
MVSFHDILYVTRELYDGVKIGFQHNYWILKNKVFQNNNRKNVIGQPYRNADIVNAKNQNGEAPGLKVVGVGFGRTGTVRATNFHLIV